MVIITNLTTSKGEKEKKKIIWFLNQGGPSSTIMSKTKSKFIVNNLFQTIFVAGVKISMSW